MPDTKRERPAPFYRGRPLTGAEVEDALQHLMDMMENDLDALGDASVTAARSEAAFRSQYAKLILTAPREHATGVQRTAFAQHYASERYERRKIDEALRDTAQEVCRVHRSDIEALRTMAASARAAETGRG